ncbi:MAG TPA: trypsin-like peptidase domain-containing protein, partial [Phototrophicaceae bacterium]|nr:trypsin-like peptidase domain-containing protein [Phototrophicaceae bacterium]
MNERPGEHEPGYPPAPAPRTEPYSVDDERSPAADASFEDELPEEPAADHPQPWQYPETRDRARRPARRFPWRPGRGGTEERAEEPAAGDQETRRYPWSASGDGAERRSPWAGTASGAADGQTAQWPAAGDAGQQRPAGDGSGATRYDGAAHGTTEQLPSGGTEDRHHAAAHATEQPTPGHPGHDAAAPWPGEHPAAGGHPRHDGAAHAPDHDAATRALAQQQSAGPARDPQAAPTGGDGTLPWSSPAGGPVAGATGGAPAYPPSGPPPELTTGGGSAGSPAAQPYAWRDPAARPWQSPDGPPPGPRLDVPSEGHRRRGRRRVGLGVVVLLVLVALLGGIVLGALGSRALWPSSSSGASLPAPTSPTTTARAPESIAGIAASALESTVYIEVVGSGGGSSGSGMVLREDGYVVTNNHVIAPAADGGGRVSVTFADGSQEPAEIVGRTSDYDIAVLKVDIDGLTPLPLADSDAVVVGDPVVAVGAPLGLEGTVTSGIISALNRPVQAGGDEGASFLNAIQTDAAINPGNSGGPLINAAGEVIGINTAIAQAGGRQTGSIGLGFAIPSNQVRRTAEQIIETGRATYPVIGV